MCGESHLTALSISASSHETEWLWQEKSYNIHFPNLVLWFNRKKKRTLKKKLLLYILLSKPRLLERKTTLLKVQRMHEVNPYATAIQKREGDQRDDSNRAGGGWNNYYVPHFGVSTQETPLSLCKSGYFLETEPRGWWTWPHQQAVHHSCGSVRPSQNERSGTLNLAPGVMCNAGPTIWTQLLSINRWEKSQPYCQFLAVQLTDKGFTKWGTLWWYISSFFTLKLLTLLVYESLIGKLFNSRDHD